ncbi:MAG TPA: hypothetical protein VK909_14540 [Anaerolineales bacterium]|nr:hypothetical protein [Anaerolineales bacterium]
MNTQQQANTNHVRILWAAVALALITALSYLLMAFNILGVGDLQMDEKPAGIIFMAAGCYLLGGVLILLRNRGLLFFGAGINALVILFFFNLYKDRPAVVFSPGGLVSKIAQLLLEFALIYVIAVYCHQPNSK